MRRSRRVLLPMVMGHSRISRMQLRLRSAMNLASIVGSCAYVHRRSNPPLEEVHRPTDMMHARNQGLGRKNEGPSSLCLRHTYAAIHMNEGFMIMYQKGMCASCPSIYIHVSSARRCLRNV